MVNAFFLTFFWQRHVDNIYREGKVNILRYSMKNVESIYYDNVCYLNYCYPTFHNGLWYFFSYYCCHIFQLLLLTQVTVRWWLSSILCNTCNSQLWINFTAVAVMSHSMKCPVCCFPIAATQWLNICRCSTKKLLAHLLARDHWHSYLQFIVAK